MVHFVTSDIARRLFSGVKGSLPFFMCFLVELHFSDLNSLVFHLGVVFFQPCPEFGAGDGHLRAAAAFFPGAAALQHK